MSERQPADADVENLTHIIEIGSAALAQESLRSDRTSSKASAQATLAGTWFAATQVVAVVALGGHSAHRHGWVIGVAVGLALQTIALFLLLHAAARVWKLRPRGDIGEETLDGLAAIADKSPQEFATAVIDTYRYILFHAQEANDERAEAFQADTWSGRLRSSSFWWQVVLALGLAEMIVALLSRVL